MANKQTGNKTLIDYTIGLPPGNATDETIQGRTDIVMENSMPIAKIYPGVPSFTKGLTLFTRKPAFSTDGDNKKSRSYLNLLRAHGYDLKQPRYSANTGNDGCIVLAYQADSFPTDSFTNDYGENFLQGLTNIASEGAASIAQMRGVEDLGQMFRQTTGSMKGKGGFTGKAGEFLDKMGTAGRQAMETLLPKSVVGGVDVVSRLAAGARIDFPMVWKGSGFQPSYTMTVRLYNPAPGNLEATKKYIAAPIAAIMLLAIPISADGITFQWPFIHKIVSPGIYNLDPAFISNITVIKGGDQQQISYKQQLGVVDVRIDFGSLYSSMLGSINDKRSRPTLQSYLSAMTGIDSEKPGVKNFSTIPGGTAQQQQVSDAEALRRNEPIAQTKNQAQTQEELTAAQKNDPPDRVTASTKTAYDNLIAEGRQLNIPIYTEAEE